LQVSSLMQSSLFSLRSRCYRCIILGLLWSISSGLLHAQSGMTFEQLQPKLQQYFIDELIGDVKDQLPKGIGYTIWGWDVGDFSGDGVNDLALSIRLAGDKSKTVNVYLFTDIEGYLTNVGKFSYNFFALPIEVGVSIKDNACSVVEKQKDFEWTVTSYRLTAGSLIVLNKFKTERAKLLTHEAERNFQTLYGTEKYRETRSGDEVFTSEFLSLPAYVRGRKIVQGYATDAQSGSIRFVTQGSFYWQGDKDCSFDVRCAYNEQYLFYLVRVKDDKVIGERVEGGTTEKIEVWLDVSNTGNRFVRSGGGGDKFRLTADSNIFSFVMTPGNFTDRKPSVVISSTDDLTDIQRQASQQVRVASSLTDSGYVIKVRIPFELLGFIGAPVDKAKITEYGCTVLVRDVDNEYRPEEETVIATSKFLNGNPSSYGSLLFVPDIMVYGEALNIYLDQIAERLRQLGM
jgi:hypothetical protein